jgi:glutamate formiminotransferase/formiminotetrahydrofolate cyclodeaminase
MASKLVECVPNFSEGRDRAVIDAITGEIAKVTGATLLDVDPGEATNRTVVTFVGTPEAAVEAAFMAIRRAAELIDMRKHSGAHARQGATDVCPFVPVAGITVEECVELARALGARVGEELQIPVYLYEAAATRPERHSLADIRVGEYEALEEKLGKPEWAPDYGPAEFNATAGATTIGVRPFLIAYNINLNTRNTKIAKDIGLTIREKGRAKRDANGKKVRDADGNLVRTPGLPNCRATGWFIEEYGRAQVTMNLTDYTVTPIHVAFDRVEEEAARLGARVTGSEVVGLVPMEALRQAGRHYLRKQGMTTGVSDGELIEIAKLSLGFDEVAPFDPAQKVIEYQVAEQTPLADLPVKDFVDVLGSNAPAPGGGSVAALAGSMAAGLASMVAALTHGKKGYTEHDELMDRVGARAQQFKDELLAAMDADTKAFDAVMECFRMPRKTEAQKAARQHAIDEANKVATLIPLGVLEACPEVLELVAEVEAKGNRNSLSDAGVGGLMARAGAYGAYYNVLINLQGIEDGAWCAEIRARADAVLARVDEAADRVQLAVLDKLRA